MIAQAESELPNECCGMLLGTRDGGVARAVKRHPLTNVAASPTRYDADSRELFAVQRECQRLGLDELAIYHSHPTSAAVPSKTDLSRAFHPHCMYLIISLQERPATVRGWWLTETDYREASWLYVD